MYLKKVLNQPTVVGTVMIALLFGAGFVYAFAFDGFNVETVPGTKVDAWLAQAEGGGEYGGGACTCDTSDDGRKRCDNCGDRVQENGVWRNPCTSKAGKNKTKQYPCSNKCEARNSHSGGTPDCNCIDNPYSTSNNRSTWKICINSNSDPCKKKYTSNRPCRQAKK